MSADSVVPGSASGSMDGVALKPLTVDFHEPGFAATLAGENAQPFWFQLNGEQRQQAGYQWGPLNPQALNRYSYVQNRPVNATDPSGHKASIAEPGAGGGGGGMCLACSGSGSGTGAFGDAVTVVAGTALIAADAQQTAQLAQGRKPAIVTVPDLTGKDIDEASQDIEGAGFEPKPDTPAYKRWYHPDGSRIWIDRDGKVDRVGPKTELKDPADPNKGTYRPRYGPDGKRLGLGQSHDTGEVVRRDP